MTTGARAFLFVAALCIALAGCGSAGDNQQQTAPTTTSTTTADPASTACRQTNMEIKARKSDAALEQLTLSRDSRIVAAAREVERILGDRELDPNPISPELDLDYAQALLELARACKVAGYLP